MSTLTVSQRRAIIHGLYDDVNGILAPLATYLRDRDDRPNLLRLLLSPAGAVAERLRKITPRGEAWEAADALLCAREAGLCVAAGSELAERMAIAGRPWIDPSREARHHEALHQVASGETAYALKALEIWRDAALAAAAEPIEEVTVNA